MAVYDYHGNILTGNIDIANYYRDEMLTTIQSVRTLQNEPNITFFLVTDIHSYFVEGAETLYKTSIENMRCLLKSVPCDGVINLGDSIEGYPDASTAKNYGNLVSEKFREIGLPYYSVIGNHDDNRYHSSSSQRLDVGTRYQVFVNPTRLVKCDSTGLNFYVDYPEYNIRCIFLNSVSDYTYKFTTDTCTWFYNVALNTPSNYNIILYTHIAPFSSWNYNNTNPTNGSVIKTALDDYSVSNNVIAVACGHNHVDDVFTTPYRGITICCEKFENENGNPSLWPSGAVKPQRTFNTASEDCWDVVIIRPNSRKMNFIRFGAGSDREISY